MDYIKAQEYAETALQRHLEIDDNEGSGYDLMILGRAHFHQSDLEKAYAYLQEALRYARQAGAMRFVVQALCNLALILIEQGGEHFAQAHEYLQEARTMTENSGDKPNAAWVYDLLAVLSLKQGNHTQSYAYFLTALKLAQATKITYKLLDILSDMAGYYVAIGDYQFAAEIIGLSTAHPHLLEMTRVGSIEPIITQLYDAISPQELAPAFAKGRNQSIEVLVNQILGHG
jgi:tetratricopeptide (TPR) repeat protein